MNNKEWAITMKSRHFLLTMLLIFGLSGCSNDSGFDETLEKAQQGSRNAQYKLGLMYANGEGVPKDETEAIRMFRMVAVALNITGEGRPYRPYYTLASTPNCVGVHKAKADLLKLCRLAADQGDAGAQTNLGVMYTTGNGVPKDEAEALKLFRLAAEQGNTQAQTNLGVMYARGEGVPKDETEALKWYLLAAEQGDAGAQADLGWMYANGEGVPKDETEAVKWYRLVAEPWADDRICVYMISNPWLDTEAVK